MTAGFRQPPPVGSSCAVAVTMSGAAGRNNQNISLAARASQLSGGSPNWHRNSITVLEAPTQAPQIMGPPVRDGTVDGIAAGPSSFPAGWYLPKRPKIITHRRRSPGWSTAAGGSTAAQSPGWGQSPCRPHRWARCRRSRCRTGPRRRSGRWCHRGLRSPRRRRLAVQIARAEWRVISLSCDLGAELALAALHVAWNTPAAQQLTRHAPSHAGRDGAEDTPGARWQER